MKLDKRTATYKTAVRNMLKQIKDTEKQVVNLVHRKRFSHPFAMELTWEGAAAHRAKEVLELIAPEIAERSLEIFYKKIFAACDEYK